MRIRAAGQGRRPRPAVPSAVLGVCPSARGSVPQLPLRRLRAPASPHDLRNHRPPRSRPLRSTSSISEGPRPPIRQEPCRRFRRNPVAPARRPHRSASPIRQGPRPHAASRVSGQRGVGHLGGSGASRPQILRSCQRGRPGSPTGRLLTRGRPSITALPQSMHRHAPGARSEWDRFHCRVLPHRTMGRGPAELPRETPTADHRPPVTGRRTPGVRVSLARRPLVTRPSHPPSAS